MTNLFTDAFTRSDSSTLGGSWTEPVGDMEINSNGVRGTAILSADIAVNSTSLGTANYKVGGSLTAGSLWSIGGGGMGLIGRYQDSSNFYLGWVDVSAPRIKLYLVSGGGFSQIGSYAASIPTDPFSLVLGLNGTTISVELDGVSRISVTDSTHSSEGDFGMRTYDGGSFNTHRFESMTVDDYAAAGQDTPELYVRMHALQQLLAQ